MEATSGSGIEGNAPGRGLALWEVNPQSAHRYPDQSYRRMRGKHCMDEGKRNEVNEETAARNRVHEDGPPKENKGNLAGSFRLKFEHNHWWLRLASWLTQFSWRACRGGDQSQFITKALFNDIGGFNESYTIYEDNVLINELYTRKQFVVINKKIKTSARLYERHGVWKLQYHFWTIYIKKWFGASAEDLYNYYKKHIA